MKDEILNACAQLVAAAANGVYQGIIIALLVALSLRWLVRTNAATRHAVWFCTLLLLGALVLAHCWMDSYSLRRATHDAGPSSDTGSATAFADGAVLWEPEARAEADSGNLADARNVRSVELEQAAGEERQPLLAALIQAEADSAAEVSEPEPEAGASGAQDDASSPASHLSRETTGFRQLMERLLNPVSVEFAVGPKFPGMASLLLALWLMIAGLRVLGLILQVVRIQKLKRRLLLPSAELGELFQRLTARLTMNRAVVLRVSPAHRSSFLLGFLHPVVLLPAGENMEPEEAELVLRHELAHLARRDDWVNLVQRFLVAVFFFHPAFWWISRQLSLEREIACDDHVLHQSQRPQTYALVLANLAARMQKPLPLLAPGSSNNKTQLKERIDMILNPHRNASPRLAKTWLALITSTAVLAALAVICAAPRIVLAASPPTGVGAAAVTPVAPVADAAPVVEVAPAAAVTGLPVPAPADNAPPALARPAAVSAGPKFKASGPVALSAPAVVVATPDVAVATVTPRLSVIAAVPGQPARVIAANEPPPEPDAPRAPRPARAPRSDDRDASLEARLDRLEHLVNSLVNQQSPKGRSDFHLKLEKDGMIDRKEIAKLEALARINPQQIEKIKEQARHEADQAAEQAKRAAAEGEKAHKAGQKQAVRKLKADSQRHLEALRRQVEVLEQQREKLDRDIERLERDQEELEEQDEDPVGSDTETSESDANVNESTEACVTHSHSPSPSTQ